MNFIWKMESIITGYIDLLKHAFPGKEAADRGPDEQKIRQETEKIKSVLPGKYYAIKSEAGQRAFIRNHYAGLVWLSDRLYEISQADEPEQEEKSGELLSVQQFVLSTLDHLLTFLREHFRSSYSEDQKIPEYSRPAVTSEILEQLETLNLPAAHPERHLFEQVKAAVRNRFREPCITYRLIGYLQALINGITRLKKSDPEELQGVTLTDFLIIFNFNDNLLEHSMISSMLKELDRSSPVRNKLDHLRRWQKKITQFPVSPAGAFKTENESVVDFLGKWVRAEILFYEKSLSVPGHSGSANFPGHAREKLKLEINLSVPQIACLLRVFTDCGIIQRSNIRELSGFTAAHFQSKKQENISSESLRVKYYNIGESTRKEVRKLASRLLEKLSSPI